LQISSLPRAIAWLKVLIEGNVAGQQRLGELLDGFKVLLVAGQQLLAPKGEADGGQRVIR
jgi:hypothetical protein